MMVAVAAVLVDVIMYLAAKEKFYCIADPVTGVCSYDTLFLFIVWGTMVIFLPVWYFVIQKMKPYCRSIDSSTEEKTDSFTAA